MGQTCIVPWLVKPSKGPTLRALPMAIFYIGKYFKQVLCNLAFVTSLRLAACLILDCIYFFVNNVYNICIFKISVVSILNLSRITRYCTFFYWCLVSNKKHCELSSCFFISFCLCSNLKALSLVSQPHFLA